MMAIYAWQRQRAEEGRKEEGERWGEARSKSALPAKVYLESFFLSLCVCVVAACRLN